MKFEEFKKQFDSNFGKKSNEDVINMLEGLGYEFELLDETIVSWIDGKSIKSPINSVWIKQTRDKNLNCFASIAGNTSYAMAA